MKRKLEEAKEEMKQKESSRKELPAEKNIGQQSPNEPEGEPKGSRNRREKSEGYDDDRSLENVDKRWLKKQYTDRGCFWCKQPGQSAQECTLMWQKVRELKAMEPKELMPNKNVFCHWCSTFQASGIQNRDSPYAGWGGHSPEHRPEQSQEMKDYTIKRREKKIW